MADEFPLPVLGFAAYSGTGKTTLLTRLIPRLRDAGHRLGVVKFTHHDVELDHPGKDSYRLREAGAAQLLIASPWRWIRFEDHPEPREPRLRDAVAQLSPERLDLVLVEGFKHEAFPKIELHRTATGRPLLYPEDPDVIAVASDEPLSLPPRVAGLDLDDIPAIAEFIGSWLGQLHRHCSPSMDFRSP